MNSVEAKEVSRIAEEFYEANRKSFIADVSLHIEKRIETGLAQFKNGKYMSIENSEKELRSELFPSN
mgnify:FL=1